MSTQELKDLLAKASWWELVKLHRESCLCQDREMLVALNDEMKKRPPFVAEKPKD